MSSTAFKQPQSSMSSTRTQTFLLLGLHHLFNLDTKSCVSVQVKWSLYQNVWSGEVYAAVHGKVLNSFNNKTLISSALLKYNIIIMQRQKHSNKQTNITTLGSCLTGQCTTGPGRSLKVTRRPVSQGHNWARTVPQVSHIYSDGGDSRNCNE